MISPETAAIYSIDKSDGGIDFSLFERYHMNSWRKARQTTVSGEDLEYAYSSDSLGLKLSVDVDLHLPEAKRRHLFARIKPNREADFNIVTVDENGASHDDLFAAQFVLMVDDLAEKLNIPIKVVRAVWKRGDNFDRYWELRDGGRDSDDAIWETWTGKLMADMGFGHAALFQEERGENNLVIVRYYRNWDGN